MMLDFVSQADYLRALLPEIVLSLAAMLVLLVDVFQKGSRSEPSRPIIGWLALAGLVAAGVANIWTLRVVESGTSAVVAVDSFRIFLNFVFLLAAALTVMMSFGYLDRRGINRGEFHVLVLFATVGMMLLASARDLILLFLALELMSTAIYVLVGFDRGDPRSSEGALKYFMLGAFASAFLLYGIALVFGSSGTINIAEVAAMLPDVQQTPMFLAGVGMMLVGLGFKAAAIPFHMWAPDAYEGASIPVTAYIAYAVLDSNAAYARTWEALYRALIRPRMMAAENATIAIVVEQNTQINAGVSRFTAEEYAALTSSGARRPAAVSEVRTVAKTDDVAVGLPDCFLGLFGACAMLLSKPNLAAAYASGKRPAAQARFERIQDKIRLIQSLQSPVRYSVKNPFVPWPLGVPT